MFVWKANVHKNNRDGKAITCPCERVYNNFVMNVCISSQCEKLNNVRGLMWGTISYVFKERIRHIRHRGYSRCLFLFGERGMVGYWL